MKLELDANEMVILLRELRYVKTRIKEPVVTTEDDYHALVGKKWGVLPPDMELDADGLPVVKTTAVPPDFRGIVAGD